MSGTLASNVGGSSDACKPNLLLAENDPATRDFLCETLRADYEVQAVADGETAWAAVQTARPALVLADVFLPALDGIDLTRRLRANPHTATVPVVLLTTNHEKELLLRGLRAGADDFLLKPLDADELRVRLHAHLSLIAVRREATAARYGDERYRLIVASALDYAIFTFGDDGRVTSWNPGAEAITGFPAGEILGQPVALVYTPEDQQNGVPGHEAERAHAVGHFYNERWHLRKDGTQFWGSGIVMPLRETGMGRSCLKILRDHTALHQAEEERTRLLHEAQAARQEAEAANQTKDRFLATLSHELRTPLNAILGWTSVLATSEVPLDPEVTQGLEVIERNARAQVQLVDDLLDMNRIVSGKVKLEIESLLLAEVIAEAAESICHSANAKGIVITQAADPLATPVYGDRARLLQVFCNLLSNAIKFTPHGGHIEVRLSEHVHSEKEAEVTVRDSGQGIAPEFLPFIFDRFYQMDDSASRRHGGLGLGLSIVKQLVELHGGAIRAESKGLGQGATFTVTLPLGRPGGAALPSAVMEKTTTVLLPVFAAIEEACHSMVHEEGGCGTELTGVRLLIVEDDADQRFLLQKLLHAHGAQVSVAEDARTGFERLRQERPQLIVSDIGLPEMDGYEFLRRVRALPEDEGGRTPAIALTAFVHAEDRRRALKAGFLTHITKPAQTAELIDTVANVAKLAR